MVSFFRLTCFLTERVEEEGELEEEELEEEEVAEDGGREVKEGEGGGEEGEGEGEREGEGGDWV